MQKKYGKRVAIKVNNLNFLSSEKAWRATVALSIHFN